jgi:hypothetical protein
MEDQHYQTTTINDDADEEELAVNNKIILEKSTNDEIEEG